MALAFCIHSSDDKSWASNTSSLVSSEWLVVGGLRICLVSFMINPNVMYFIVNDLKVESLLSHSHGEKFLQAYHRKLGTEGHDQCKTQSICVRLHVLFSTIGVFTFILWSMIVGLRNMNYCCVVPSSNITQRVLNAKLRGGKFLVHVDLFWLDW